MILPAGAGDNAPGGGRAAAPRGAPDDAPALTAGDLTERGGRVRFAWNPYHDSRRAEVRRALATVPPAGDVLAFHRSLPGYAPTPLQSLTGLARRLDLGALWLKDESARFGLNAFKALGASYAIRRLLAERADAAQLTLTTATDGNHGRAVAWTARTLGHRSVIFVPRGMAPARVAAIRGEGAEVIVVDGSYDDAVRRAAAEATARGWQVVSDTAYTGYLEIPGWITAGYQTLFAEAMDQLAGWGQPGPDVVLLQAGVGGFAASGLLFFARCANESEGASALSMPRIVVVEPTDADCCLESILAPGGELVEGSGKQESIMAGLNCGLPSLLAWPLLRAGADAFLAVADEFAETSMRTLAFGRDGDSRVVAGESGAAGLAGLLALCGEPALGEARRRLGLGSSARVLLVSTEGATDPEGYRRVVGP
jgi:diaminopropionate ammonia-lyase